MSDFRSLIETIFELEEHHDLFERRVFGVYYWSVLRNAVAGDAARAAGLFTAVEVGGESAGLRKIPCLLRTGLVAFVRFLNRRNSLKRDTGLAILSHRVKKEVDGAYAERFTLDMLRRWDASAPVVLDQADTSASRFSRISGRAVVPVEWIYIIGKIFGYAVGWVFALHPEMRRLDQCMAVLGVSGMRRRYHRKLAKFLCEERLFAAVFRRTRLEELLLTVSYGERSIIAAARESGIRVREYQHNPISPWSLGYAMPHGGDMPYAPDILMVYGAAWHTAAPYPARMWVETVPKDKDADANCVLPSAAQRDPDAVVLLSQPDVAADMAMAARILAQRCPDCRVYYRPHPLDGWSKGLLQDFSATNLHINEGNSVDAILSLCTFQVGAFSTALIRGLQLGCRTIVLDVPGSEHFDWIVQRGDAIRVSDAEDLAERWRHAPAAAEPSSYRTPVR